MHAAAPAPREAIQVELEKVLASSAFRNSRRCQDFLRYVVEKTLAGEADTLKERTIGIEVFGKDLAYDASGDPLVRVRAGDIRKRLGVYYYSHPAPTAVIIELPSGSYVPVFRYPQKESALAVDVATGMPQPASLEALALESVAVEPALGELWHREGVEPEAKKPIRFSRWALVVCLGLAVFVALSVAMFFNLHRVTLSEKFWAPVLDSSARVIVGAAYTPIYLKTELGVPNEPEYSLAENGYLGGGDLVAAAEVSGMLGSLHHAFAIRVGNSLSFQDLSAAPSVLIGYSVRFWAPLMKNFRYSIQARDGMILDNGKPTQWVPHNLKHDLHVDDDYAVVVRTFHPETHEMMILVYGSEQYGTQAAAMLITEPDLLNAALKSAPPGWEHKSLQLVLHSRIIDNTPTVPEVVASYYW